MKQLIAMLIVIAISLALNNTAVAGDADDVKAATLEHFATLNAGNARAHVQHHMAGHSTYNAGGGLLEVSNSLSEETASLKVDFDSGLKLNLELRHLDVKVYGDAAVVTGYVVGTATAPDGSIDQVTDRRSAVLIKEGGKWREVHLHSSPVIAGPQQ